MSREQSALNKIASMSVKQCRDVKQLTQHQQSLTHSWSLAKTVVRKARRMMLRIIQNSRL